MLHWNREWHTDAMVLRQTSPGLINRRIEDAIKDMKPLSMTLLREALSIESARVNSRPEVRNMLKREIARQELTCLAAA